MGVGLDWQSKLIVILACERSFSHSFMGRSGAMPARMLRKFALKLLMATSAAFLRWQPGGGLICMISYRCQ